VKVLILLPRDKPRSLLDDLLLFALARAEALSGMGHQADLLSPEGTGGAWETLGEKIVQAGLPGLGEWTRRGARGRAAFLKKLKKEKYDLAEVVWGGGMELFLPCLEGVPFTARFSGPLLEEPGRSPGTLERELTRFLERSAGGRLAGFTAGSARLAGRVRERLRASCLYWVVHPGVKVERFRGGGNPSSSPGQGPVLCLLGGEEEEKGRFLADLVGPLLEEGKDLSFRVLAGRADSPAARAVEEALGGPDPAPGSFRLEEAPGEEALPGLLEECRAFLVPSFEEGGLYALLCAMASGKPVLVPESPWIYEYVRPEIDGLVLPGGKVEAFRGGLERILVDGKRAAALGEKARGRVEERFRVEETARTSLAFWVHAASLRGRGEPSKEDVPLGPGNWFQAWWAWGGPKVSHSLEKGPGGKPLLADLSLEELGFLERFLSRAWWEQGGDWDSPEAELLREIGALLEETARKARSWNEGRRPRETGLMALPPLDHPLFRESLADVFFQESWSVRPTGFYRAWVEKEAERSWFQEEGIQAFPLRKLVVLSAADFPSEILFRVLRRAYRESPLRRTFLEEDRAFFEEGEKGGIFRKAVEKLGLHFPLKRPPVFGKRSRGSKVFPSRDGSLPAVTVLVPSYKHERFIARTLESALGQTYPEVRVLVVDDCSPDGTVEKARSLADARLSVEVNETNLGLGRSLLSVLSRVETPYVALLNSDDLFHPERIAACVEALEGNPGAAVAATELVFSDSRDRALTAKNTPLVETGPRIRDLVVWYEQEIRGGDPPLDRTALDGLLRHNHLLTSSNIFCRTEYIREKASLFEDLLYTVDWCLFLESAREGRLLFIDRPLLAYRLHETNTMWFEEESRPGYVMEIHRLLSGFFRRMTGEGKGKEAARLALESAGKHGEVEGWFLFLAGLGLLPPVEEAPAWLKKRIGRIVSEKGLLREAARNGLDWLRLGNLLWEAEMFLPAETGAQACRLEKAGLEGRLRWAEGAREEFRRWAEDEAAQRERLGGENAALLRELEEVRARERGLESEAARLRERIAALEKDVAAGADRIRALEEERKALEGRIHSILGELEEARENARALERSMAREREAFLEEARKARARRKELLHRLHVERTRARESHQWQVGSFLLDRMRLLGVYKTLQRGWRNLAAETGRASGRIGTRTGKVLLASSGAFPSPREFSLYLEGRALEKSGLPVEWLCWGRGRGAFPGKRRVLPRDGLLQKRDRSFFAKRNPEGARAVESLPVGDEWKGRIFTFARTARALGAPFLQAAGLGLGAWEVFGAHLLLGVPYGISLSMWDLQRPGGEEERVKCRALLGGASSVTVETEAAGGELARLLGEPPPGLLVRGVIPVEGKRGTRSGRFRVAAFGTVVPERELALLPEALGVALEKGAELEIRFHGGPGEDPDGLEAWDTLLERVRGLGLSERFLFPGDPSPGEMAGILGEADLVVEGSLDPGGTEGLVFLAGALEAGIPAAAPREGTLEDLREGGGLRLYERGDAAALGDLLAELSTRPGREEGEGPLPAARHFFRPEGVAAWRGKVSSPARAGRGG